MRGCAPRRPADVHRDSSQARGAVREVRGPDVDSLGCPGHACVDLHRPDAGPPVRRHAGEQRPDRAVRADAQDLLGDRERMRWLQGVARRLCHDRRAGHRRRCQRGGEEPLAVDRRACPDDHPTARAVDRHGRQGDRWGRSVGQRQRRRQGSGIGCDRDLLHQCAGPLVGVIDLIPADDRVAVARHGKARAGRVLSRRADRRRPAKGRADGPAPGLPEPSMPGRRTGATGS